MGRVMTLISRFMNFQIIIVAIANVSSLQTVLADPQVRLTLKEYPILQNISEAARAAIAAQKANLKPFTWA